MTLETAARDPRNNFGVLRLAAATLVLVSHSFVVAGRHEPTVGRFQLGTLGVEIFFAISGFLVAKSWFTQPRPIAFAIKRALRVVPALAVTVLALAFVLGPIVSHESVGTYLGDAQTYLYPVDNLAATVSANALHHVSHDLPGVFTDQPDTSVDRSLWTLPLEMQAYLALALVGMLGLLTRGLPFLAAGCFALSVAPSEVFDTHALAFLRVAQDKNGHLLALFFVAALLYQHRARVPLRLDLAAVAAVAAIAALGSPLERWVLVAAIPYLVLVVAYRSWGRLRVLTEHADVSYGLYLLAFPVQQTVVHAWGGGRPAPGVVALIAFPVTYLLALASWHGVEKRALRLKGVLVRRPPEPESWPSPGSLSRA